MTVGAVLLAAGGARRMGEDKLLAELGGKPMLLHAFDAIADAGLEGPIVAVAPGSAIARLLAGRAALIEVADHRLGMGASLAAAIRAVPPDWSAAIICLGDMPFVRASTLTALVRAGSATGVARPCFAGRPGNPVLWAREHFAALAALRGDEGGRALLGGQAVRLVECDDPGIAIDIDTPQALAAARRRFPLAPRQAGSERP